MAFQISIQSIISIRNEKPFPTPLSTWRDEIGLDKEPELSQDEFLETLIQLRSSPRTHFFFQTTF